MKTVYNLGVWFSHQVAQGKQEHHPIMSSTKTIYIAPGKLLSLDKKVLILFLFLHKNISCGTH